MISIFLEAPRLIKRQDPSFLSQIWKLPRAEPSGTDLAQATVSSTPLKDSAEYSMHAQAATKVKPEGMDHIQQPRENWLDHAIAHVLTCLPTTTYQLLAFSARWDRREL